MYLYKKKIKSIFFVVTCQPLLKSTFSLYKGANSPLPECTFQFGKNHDLYTLKIY